jgi:hypothetical protein
LGAVGAAGGCWTFAAGGTFSPASGALRMPISAAGIPTITSSVAVTSIAACGRCIQPRGRARSGAEAGASSTPSNLRIAASIAASRLAGRGGGGLGSQWSSSPAIYRASSIT